MGLPLRILNGKLSCRLETAYIWSLFLSHSLFGLRIQFLQLLAISTLEVLLCYNEASVANKRSVVHLIGIPVTRNSVSLVAFKSFLLMIQVLQYYHLVSIRVFISVYPLHYSLCSFKCKICEFLLIWKVVMLLEYRFHHPFFFSSEFPLGYMLKLLSLSSMSFPCFSACHLFFSLCCLLGEFPIQLSRAQYVSSHVLAKNWWNLWCVLFHHLYFSWTGYLNCSISCVF